MSKRYTNSELIRLCYRTMFSEALNNYRLVMGSTMKSSGRNYDLVNFMRISTYNMYKAVLGYGSQSTVSAYKMKEDLEIEDSDSILDHLNPIQLLACIKGLDEASCSTLSTAKGDLFNSVKKFINSIPCCNLSYDEDLPLSKIKPIVKKSYPTRALKYAIPTNPSSITKDAAAFQNNRKQFFKFFYDLKSDFDSVTKDDNDLQDLLLSMDYHFYEVQTDFKFCDFDVLDNQLKPSSHISNFDMKMLKIKYEIISNFIKSVKASNKPLEKYHFCRGAELAREELLEQDIMPETSNLFFANYFMSMHKSKGIDWVNIEPKTQNNEKSQD